MQIDDATVYVAVMGQLLAKGFDAVDIEEAYENWLHEKETSDRSGSI